MTFVELVVFVLICGLFLLLGHFLSLRWGTLGFLIGAVPVGLGMAFIAFGSVYGTIIDLRWSFRSRPVCCRGKCASRRYILVSSTVEHAVFRCRCGDMYMNQGESFLHLLPDGTLEPYMVRDSSGIWQSVQPRTE
jgi:hypothetical protein